MKVPAHNISLPYTANRYKYSGKKFETRGGLNSYDFHARQYAPALPLFDTTDPKAWDAPWNNTYLYCSANPINRIDPTGMTDYLNKRTGKFLGTDGDEATSDTFRAIYEEDYNANCENVEVLEQLSILITIDEDAIQQMAQKTRDNSLSDELENQMYIYYDRQTYTVSCMEGEKGTNESAGIIIRAAETQGVCFVDDDAPYNKIFLGQLHGHTKNKENYRKTLSQVSSDDIISADIMQVPIFAVDAMSNSGASDKIYVVYPDGTIKNNKGVTIGTKGPASIKGKTISIGATCLKQWSRSLKPKFEKMPK